MRTVAIVVVVLLAGCGTKPDSEAAREICIKNGAALGSPEFHRCFETTYAAIRGVPQPVASAPRVATTCQRVGATTICN